MNLDYTEKGKFVPETQKLIEELKADAVLLIVFGSRTKGSGACCEMRVADPEPLARVVVEQMRMLADSIEADNDRGALAQKAEVMEDDQNGHEQTEHEYSTRSLRPGQPSPGNHL